MSQPSQPRIAIIGAGVSGLTAGLELKRNGFNHVVIFEKDDRVGGKTFSYAYKDHHFDIGSMMFSRSSKVARLADEYHIPYESFDTKRFYHFQGEYLDPLTYARKYYSLFEIARSFYHLRQHIQESRLVEPGYVSVDPELFQSFQSYLEQHDLLPIGKLFEPAISGLGYGYFGTTPALYNIKILSAMLDTSLLKSILTNGNEVCYFPGGWMALWERVATDLDVRLSQQITRIERTSTGTIHLTINGQTEVFDHLIITTPLDHLQEYLDISPEERALFGKIRSYRMVSTLIEGSKPLFTGYLVENTIAERFGHVFGTECYAPETNCSVLFQTVPKDMAPEEVNRILTEDVSDLGCTLKKIITQKEWEYFYHVSSEDLKEGFYEKLNGLQGVRNTFYLGSIFNYETVGHCQQFAEHLIQTYFPVSD